MLRALRSMTRFATLLAVLASAALSSSSFARGPRLSAKITEPFQLGERTVSPGTLSVNPVSGYHPGGSIDELWIGTEFLGLFVADASSDPSSTKHDAFLFERDVQGRLTLVGYVVHGSRSDVAYRYRPATAALEAAIPRLSGGTQHERGLATP